MISPEVGQTMLAVIGPERHATITPSREGEGVMVACSVRLCVADVTLRYSGADGLLDVESEQQLSVQLVGTADEVAGLALERVRRRLEVTGVHVDDVGDGVHQQAD